MYLAGTHDAMPKGAFLPGKGAEVQARIGPFLDHAALLKIAGGAGKAESYRKISVEVERMVRKMCPEEYAWTLGERGREPAAPEKEKQEPGARKQETGSGGNEVRP
jgi:hypothetical protein